MRTTLDATARPRNARCSPTAPPAPTTSGWGSGRASRLSCGTSSIPSGCAQLHEAFVAAGADIILTNTFGCNRYRLKLHNAEQRAYELAKRAAEIAGEVAAAADRPVVVAGSIGPTGELLIPLGTMSEDDATAAFAEQAAGLRDGGADIAWIETKSAPEEMRAAATAAIAGRSAVRRDGLVRHRRPHDDGPPAIRACGRVRRAVARRRSRSAPTAGSARPTCSLARAADPPRPWRR